MGSSKRDIETSYDVSNDFFRLWLDEELNYTCALFESEADTLEEAQRNKLRFLCDAAGVTPESSVLDIGCGWGACLAYLVRDRNVRRATGVTLSPEQHRVVLDRDLPRTECVCHDFTTWTSAERFDALVSICMIDHLCSPAQARAGLAVDVYRAFFEKCWRMTAPGAKFALQTILRVRAPRDPQDLADVYFCTHTIFPGGLNPRLEEVAQAASPYWEVLSVHTRRAHYEKTTGAWLARLRRHEATVRERWGDKLFDDYERYLSTCVRAFQRHYSSLAQYELKRIDA
jgi:cyclopropane-fatty-acyl-phospholipid synthase